MFHSHEHMNQPLWSCRQCFVLEFVECRQSRSTFINKLINLFPGKTLDFLYYLFVLSWIWKLLKMILPVDTPDLSTIIIVLLLYGVSEAWFVFIAAQSVRVTVAPPSRLSWKNIPKSGCEWNYCVRIFTIGGIITSVGISISVGKITNVGGCT